MLLWVNGSVVLFKGATTYKSAGIQRQEMLLALKPFLRSWVKTDGTEVLDPQMAPPDRLHWQSSNF